MSQRKRWTDEEEQVIIREVSNTPNNLESAFRRASTSINRTPKAIAMRWHRTLREREDVGVLFMTCGRKYINANRKIISTKTSDNTKRNTVSIWNTIKSIIFRR